MIYKSPYKNKTTNNKISLILVFNYIIKEQDELLSGHSPYSTLTTTNIN